MDKLTTLSAQRRQKLSFQKTCNVTNIFDVQTAKPEAMFLSRFAVMPNVIAFKFSVNTDKATSWITEQYAGAIKDCIKRETFNYEKYEFELEYVDFFLFEDLLLHVSRYAIEVLFRRTDLAIVDKIVNELKKCRIRRKRYKPEILLISSEGRGTTAMEVTKPRLSVEDNYNDDLLPVHDIIVKRLSKKKDKGLVLLHGKPGTGKTSYLRFLIYKTRKPVIFLPPNMAAHITDINLMEILIENPNSIFVIEDAENIIIDRNHNGSSAVSALLNLADGLLSDCLNIQIICSFNTDLAHVDSALLRKGRLIAKYEFKELETAKAQKLSDSLGFNTTITKPMTLADIYNQNDPAFSLAVNRPAIGFTKAG